MKKVLQIALALGFGFFALASVASAQELDCSIFETGSASYNACMNNNVEVCEVLNNNVISVNNVEGQTSVSGDPVVVGNTSGGGASSGDSSNSNEFNFTGTVINGACVPNTPVVTTPTPTPTDVPAVVTPQATPAVKTLPKTNGTSPAVFAGATVAVLLGAVVASRFGLAAYSKLKG